MCSDFQGSKIQIDRGEVWLVRIAITVMQKPMRDGDKNTDVNGLQSARAGVIETRSLLLMTHAEI